MTVRQRMDQIKKSKPSLLDSGEYILDHRPYGILQDTNSSEITVVYESKDDLDENDKPVVKEMIYTDLKDFFVDHPPSY